MRLILRPAVRARHVATRSIRRSTKAFCSKARTYRVARSFQLVSVLLLPMLGACVEEERASVPFAPSFASSPLASGQLDLCKQAGEGIATDAPFAFDITYGAVSLVLSVPAGQCLSLGVAREGSVLSKGYFKGRPADIERLLPRGVLLTVDDADLTALQVHAVLDAPAQGGPSVDVGGNTLLLTLVQQLLAADLNVLRGVQVPANVATAIAAANAAIEVTVTGSGSLRITTSLTQSEMSALVNVLSRFNEGRLKVSDTPPSAVLNIVEQKPSNVDVTAIACDPAARCTGADLAAGRVSVTVVSGEITTVTFTNLARTVLRLCKAAGAGVATGTPFTIVAQQGTDEVGGAIAAGSCGDFDVAEGAWQVFESDAKIPFLYVASAITCDPAAQCTNISLGGSGLVTVSATKGAITTVTFTNRSVRGTLRLCKVAGPGVAAGTPFTIVAQKGSDEVGNPIEAGSCEDFDVAEGIWQVAEFDAKVPVEYRPSAITCDPVARCTDISLAGSGSVKATVVGAELTTVTYTNRSVRGTLRICKVAGAGVAAGTLFSFVAQKGADEVGGPTATGSCSDFVVAEGTWRVFESDPNVPFVYAPTAITCNPATQCANISLAGSGSADVTVVGGEVIGISFTNTAVSAGQSHESGRPAHPHSSASSRSMMRSPGSMR